MAEKGISIQKTGHRGRVALWQRMVAVAIAILIICATAPMTGAQQPRPRNEAQTTPAYQHEGVPRNPNETGTKKESNNPNSSLTGEGERVNNGVEDQTRENEVGESYTDPNLEAEAERVARRRTRPEKRPFYFSAQYATRYDDNVVFGDVTRRSDIVSLPEFGLGFTRVRARSLTRLDYAGGAEIYHRTSSLNGFLHSIDFDWEYDLGRHTTFFVRDFFLTRPNPTRLSPFSFTPTTIANVGGVSPNASALNALVATRSTFNQLNTGVQHQLSRYSSVRAIAGYAFTRFSSDQLVNNTEQSLELGYSRQTSRKLVFDFAYRASRINSQGTAITHTVLPSVNYQRSERLRFRFGAGPQAVLIGGNHKVFWSAVAEVTYSHSRKTSLAATYTAGVGTSGGLAGVTRNHTVFTTYSRRLGNAQLELRSGYSRASAANIGPREANAPGSTNQQLIAESQISIPVGEKLAVFFQYSHARQFSGANASGVTGSTSRNLFSVGINFDTRRTSRERQATIR